VIAKKSSLEGSNLGQIFQLVEHPKCRPRLPGSEVVILV